jgi:small subunit ribosomal protein S6
MKRYEAIVIFDPDLSEQVLNQQIAKVRDLVASHKGTIEKEEVIGRQQLAYPINKRTYGNYVLFVLSAEGTFVADFTRQMRISDEVLRSMTVKKDKFAPDFVRRQEKARDFQPGFDGLEDDSMIM